MEQVETVIVGAGVIGLAIARYLAVRGQEVLILEAEGAVGRHTSTRNSQVIHAGIYYPRGSAQQVLCLKGRQMLYDYCASRHVGHRRIGKLTVARKSAEVDQLHALAAQGRANGVDDLSVISAAALAEREPAVVGAGAMLSPSSGIVDAPGLMLSLLGEAEAGGAMLALNARFLRARKERGRFLLEVGGAIEVTIGCKRLVNAAALGAWGVASGIDGMRVDSIPPCNLAKGNYFSIPGPSPFSALIYPMPKVGSLGIHSVQDLGGGVRFGPDMHWVDVVDYSVDPEFLPQFEAEIRSYWPGLPEGVLRPDMAGIRPRIWGFGSAKREFEFQDSSVHGVAGLVQLFGFESPGLTACLAIAEHVGELLGKGDDQ
ncbi:MAG: NAD(P)/FAD-dependent oxidoreductase [Rhodobacteraceae bacterium]|nr:NAD(P)/FAD-dependent oxidoreductase [Paracoccaceae bacterium]